MNGSMEASVAFPYLMFQILFQSKPNADSPIIEHCLNGDGGRFWLSWQILAA